MYTRDSAVNRNLLSHPRRRTHVLVTRAAVGAIFHLSKIDGIRAGHTYANDKILAIIRDHCYATNFGTAGGGCARARERERGNQYLHWIYKRHSVGNETLFSGDLLPLYRVIFPGSLSLSCFTCYSQNRSLGKKKEHRH